MSAEQRLPMASSCLRLPKVHSNPLVREAASEHDGQRLRVVAQVKWGSLLSQIWNLVVQYTLLAFLERR